jgi:hypothetical protein
MNMTTTIDKAREMMTAFATYPPGTAVNYYNGFLINDRTRGRGASDEKRQRADAINSVANLAMCLATDGKAHLTQRRLGHENFAYIATRSSRK